MGSFSACQLFFHDHEPDFVEYNLFFSFRDVAGNDLLKGIGLENWCCPADIPEKQAHSGSVKSDLYVLSIIASNQCEDVTDSWNTSHGLGKGYRVYNSLGMSRLNSNSYSYLTTNCRLAVNDCPDEKVLTYKLKYPYVFGDEAVHEFVTYWEIPKIRNMSAYAKCTHIEFESRVITQMIYEDYNNDNYS
jgi:hypothetical protein